MGDRIKYERPVLIDMALGSVLGITGDCGGGYAIGSCTVGSCVSKAYCQYGNWTGYCESGTQACGNNSACYVCCQEGAMVGSLGIQRGSGTTCDCSAGATAACVCSSGSRTSFACVSGDYYDAVNCQA